MVNEKELVEDVLMNLNDLLKVVADVKHLAPIERAIQEMEHLKKMIETES